jgi:hypothetical protein
MDRMPDNEMIAAQHDGAPIDPGMLARIEQARAHPSPGIPHEDLLREYGLCPFVRSTPTKRTIIWTNETRELARIIAASGAETKAGGTKPARELLPQFAMVPAKRKTKCSKA